MDNEYRAIDDLVRNHFANVVWTHKIQEKQAEIYEARYKLLATTNIVTASLTSAGVFSTVFVDPTWVKIVSTIAAFVTTAISAYLTSFDYKSMARANKVAATKLVALRDELLILLEKIKFRQQPIQELTAEFDALQKRIHDVYTNAPNTTSKAVDMAEVSLKSNKDGTYTDAEIDSLLPNSLKRENNYE